MHSANRAKLRQKIAIDQATLFNKQQSNKKDVQIAFGSRIHTTRRSKSLDRKSNLRKVQQIREQSVGKLIFFIFMFHFPTKI